MDKEKLIECLKTGSEIAGGVVGGAIGLIGGPAGAMIGGGAGVVVSKGLIEITERFLSSRESIRASASAAYSITSIDDRIKQGEELRSDDFFDVMDGRSKAEELFEGVLIKCKNEYQEKKIKFISNIYSNAVFDSNLSAENANQILTVAETLSYRKMSILKLMKYKDTVINLGLRDSDYRTNGEHETGAERMSLELELLLQDFMDLCNIGLIERKDSTAMIDISDVNPKGMQLSTIGQKYYDLMGLKDIESTDLDEIIENLKKST